MFTTIDTLVDDFARRLSAGQAALFVGAGMSRGSGLADWKGLLAKPARELGIDIGPDAGFPDVAEFYAQKFNRNALIQHVWDTLDRSVEFTENHRLIAHLPARGIWTTNYDDLLEKAFKDAGKTYHVMRQDGDLFVSRPNPTVHIYKMHGDFASAPNHVVITQTDYDRYDQRYPVMASKFFNALADTTLLFLGFGFSDPNFRRIMGSLVSRSGGNIRSHYAVMLRPSAADAHEARRFELFLDTLTTLGVQVSVVDQPAEITRVLKQIGAKCPTPPEILTGQDARNEFLVSQLESLELHSLGSSIDLRIAAVFSEFAVSDDPRYWAEEPSSSPAHMQRLLRTRAILENLVLRGEVRLKLLLCPPNSPESRLHVRYEALLEWLERNIDRPNLDVRCATIDYFENAMIARDRFCIVAGYSPLHGYHENRIYRDRQSIEQQIADFDNNFEHADVARSKEEAIAYYRRTLSILTNGVTDVWKTASSDVLRQWRGLSLISDTADIPGRGQIEYVFVHHPGSVIVIPVTSSGNLLVVEQYRYLTKAHSLEFPAGGLEPDESPLQAAKREFREETGYSAQEWERLGEFFTTNGITDESMTAFLARGLERDPSYTGDESERTVVKEHALEKLCEMIWNGTIRDGPTIVCIHYFKEFLSGR